MTQVVRSTRSLRSSLGSSSYPLRADGRLIHMPKTQLSLPTKGVLGWVVLLRRLWDAMDETIAIGRALAKMCVRLPPRRVARIAQVCSELGYTSPTNQRFPHPSGLPEGTPEPSVQDKHAAYQVAVRERERCSHEKMKKPYTAAGHKWTLCHLCGRRWRSEPDPRGQHWVIDDPDDPDRRPASQASRPSSSQLVPSSGPRIRAPRSKALPPTSWFNARSASNGTTRRNAFPRPNCPLMARKNPSPIALRVSWDLNDVV